MEKMFSLVVEKLIKLQIKTIGEGEILLIRLGNIFEAFILIAN